MLFPSGFPKNSCGNLTIPRGFHYVSLRKPVISMWLPPIFHRGKPLVDPSFPSMEACKPERRVFPPRGKPHGKRYFPGWKPHGNVVNLWFPCGFPYVSPEGKSFFHPVTVDFQKYMPEKKCPHSIWVFFGGGRGGKEAFIVVNAFLSI